MRSKSNGEAMAELYRNDPTPLYRTLSPADNPALSSLTAILETMGLQLAIQPIGAQAALQARYMVGGQVTRLRMRALRVRRAQRAPMSESMT